MGYLKNQYNGAALATYERIQDGHEAIIINKVYESKTASCLFYINSKGFLHVLRPSKTTLNGKITGYCLIDYMLTKDNTLREKSTTKDVKTINELKNYITELIA